MTAKRKKPVERIVPLGSRLLARRDVAADTTAGGIVLPGLVTRSSKERPKTATVLAVGIGRILENGKRELCELQPGDRIVVGKHAGVEIHDPENERERLVVLDFEEVMGRLDGEAVT